ncbi:phosphatidate cytidylyltransferase [Melioribacteraceae bacterium 4301-Me]|uniref:phosphatidate cytidylyltransferase n=1 Tax=Pyranulibacter aquaticus TaxID=3163344 RepID=UPI003597FD2B
MNLSNTTIRVIVAFVGIPTMLFVCWYGKFLFYLLTLAIGLVAYYEFSKIIRKKNSNANLIIGCLAIISIVTEAYNSFVDFKVLVLCIIILTLSFELFRNKGSAVNNLGGTFIGVFYIGLFASTLILIREYYNQSEFLYNRGGYLIISVLATIWICDSAAFFLGSSFGRHKLFPRVSPNKSWEGAIAGFMFSLITMIVMKELLVNFISILDAVVLGVIIGVFGQLGDLVESLLKRDVDVKDSSSILPGHGGIFDRFDSLLFSSPFIYLYMFFFFR